MKKSKIKFTMEMRLGHMKDFLISFCGWALFFSVIVGTVIGSFALIDGIASEVLNPGYLIVLPFFWALCMKLSGVAIDWMEY